MRLPASFSCNETQQRSEIDIARRIRLQAVAFVVICLLFFSPQIVAQEKYLVSTDDGLLSLYDLATNTFIQAVKGSLGLHFVESNISTNGVPLRGPSDRLAFDVSGAYVSVIDLTINRETNRLLRDVFEFSSGERLSAVTPDGRYLLIAFLAPVTKYSESFLLYVIDTSSFEVVQKVDLTSAFQGYPGSVVAVNNKAYVFPRSPSPTQKLAIIDLNTFALSSIPLPAGNLNYRPSVVTPDGSFVLAFEDENSDHVSHLLFISTAMDGLVNDIPQTQRYSATSFAISPPGTDSSNTFAYFTALPSAYAIDLRPNSPTYGRVLPGSAVTLDFDFSLPPHGLAVSSDGSRLIAVGEDLSPGTNVDVIDTAKMLTDPQNAIIARVTVNNGVGAAAVCTGNFSTIPPVTAPTVSGVSGNITNDMPRQIEVTGTNFQQGALLRIGSMDPLSTEVTNSTTLNVTVPVNAPAGKALDIIVTNPESNSPPDQRNQSGLLAGQFTILPNPKFQPKNQIATVDLDNSVSIYSVAQQTMANVSMPGGSLAPAFNIDGKELYIAGGIGFYNDIFPIDLKNNQLASPIQICSTDDCAPPGLIAGSRDPSTGNPVVDFVQWAYDQTIHVSVIDSNPASQTFNTVIRTFVAGVNIGFLNTMTVSPDGKYCYISYDQSLGILNLSNGQFTSISAISLGVLGLPYQIGISPDGKFMLLPGFRGSRTTVQVFGLSNPIQPKRLFELVPVPIPNRGFPYLVYYQVAGGRLYATDTVGTVVVFNFDWQKNDFREAGYYINQSGDFWGGFKVSPDGAYFYATDYINDQVLVFDAAKLSYGRDALLTAIRAPYYPYTIDVSPSTPPALRATVKK